jgi:hypothetical protein
MELLQSCVTWYSCAETPCEQAAISRSNSSGVKNISFLINNLFLVALDLRFALWGNADCTCLGEARFVKRFLEFPMLCLVKSASEQ